MINKHLNPNKDEEICEIRHRFLVGMKTGYLELVSRNSVLVHRLIQQQFEHGTVSSTALRLLHEATDEGIDAMVLHGFDRLIKL